MPFKQYPDGSVSPTPEPPRTIPRGRCHSGNAIADGCSIEDINKHCLEEFRKHWQCLDDNNQQLWQCRKAEWKLNTCVFNNLVRPNARPCQNIRARAGSGPSRLADSLRRSLRRSSPTPRASRCTSAASRSMPTTLFSETLARSPSARPSTLRPPSLPRRRKSLRRAWLRGRFGAGLWESDSKRCGISWHLCT